ncbi:MAG: hypothetical protein AAFQ85_01360 [Pseudomonadota bacterium]
MRAILALIMLLALAWLAPDIGQANPASSAPKVHFIVDASGSMRAHEDETERKINARSLLTPAGYRKQIRFFGGKVASGNEVPGCRTDVVIEPPKSIDSGTWAFTLYGGPASKTSIGGALEIALRQASDDDIIVLVTDGAEECGSDFSTIRTTFPSVEIEVIQVGENPNTALNLLEIPPREIVQTQSLPTPLPIKIVSDAPQPDERPGFYLFVEKWTWLLGLLSIYLL